MSLSLHIEGNDAADLLSNLRTVAAALLGSASVGAIAAPLTSPASTGAPSAVSVIPEAPAATSSASTAEPSSAGTSTSETAQPSASPSDAPEFDAAGTAWDPNKHASTKGKTSAGLWRMKVGVSRPANEATPLADPAAAPPPPPPPAPVAAPAEDDEFAAFRAAASPEAAPAAPVARSWTDADLSKLCNQAALAKGSPDAVKAVIAKYVPAGEVPHSRNVPAEQREAFAQEVESACGIQYAG